MIFATVISLFLLTFSTGCTRGVYDIDSETDRKAMIVDARNALSTGDCPTAMNLSTQLFQSKYTNNEIRMLYASAHGCNVGIELLTLMDDLSESDLSSSDAMFKTLVRLFPSRTALDSKLQSTWYMQSTLQTMLKLGAIVGAPDKFYIDSYNIGSVLTRDRVDDGNALLVFSSMASVGTALNRYGYAATDDPATFAYTQVLDLTWITQALIKADTTNAGCALASALMNMFDSMNAVSDSTTGPLSTVFSLMTQAQAAVDVAGMNQCDVVDAHTTEECNIAATRLRYLNSCSEQDPVASYAAGVIQAINAGWL